MTFIQTMNLELNKNKQDTEQTDRNTKELNTCTCIGLLISDI